MDKEIKSLTDKQLVQIITEMLYMGDAARRTLGFEGHILELLSRFKGGRVLATKSFSVGEVLLALAAVDRSKDDSIYVVDADDVVNFLKGAL